MEPEQTNPEPRPESRRGKVLAVVAIQITLANGTVETWEFPPEDIAYYREGRNSRGKGKEYETWKTHELWWYSERRVAAPAPVEPQAGPEELV